MHRITDNFPAVTGLITAVTNGLTGWIVGLLNMAGVQQTDRLVDAAWQVGVTAVIVILSFVLQKFLRWTDKKIQDWFIKRRKA